MELCSTHGYARHTARCSTERVMEIAEAQAVEEAMTSNVRQEGR